MKLQSRILLIFISIQLAFGQMGLAVEMHFCMDMMREVSFFTPVKGCLEAGDEAELSENDFPGDNICSMSCCENKTFIAHNDNDKSNFATTDIDISIDLGSIPTAGIDYFEISDECPQLIDIPPPIHSPPLYILHESYLL